MIKFVVARVLSEDQSLLKADVFLPICRWSTILAVLAAHSCASDRPGVVTWLPCDQNEPRCKQEVRRAIFKLVSFTVI